MAIHASSSNEIPNCCLAVLTVNLMLELEAHIDMAWTRLDFAASPPWPGLACSRFGAVAAGDA